MPSNEAWAQKHWDSTVDLAELNRGRQYYIRSCSSCHTLHKPSERTEEQWLKAMEKMKPKAKIADTTAQVILKYLIAGSKDFSVQ